MKKYKLESSLLITFLFLIGFISAFLISTEGIGKPEDTVLAKGSIAKAMATQEFSNCRGTVIYIDEHGEERVLFRHKDVPEAEDKTGAHF